MKALIVPALVVTTPNPVNPRILAGKAERDAFADEMLAREIQDEAKARQLARARDAYAELFPEGRVHRNTRTNRNED